MYIDIQKKKCVNLNRLFVDLNRLFVELQNGQRDTQKKHVKLNVKLKKAEKQIIDKPKQHNARQIKSCGKPDNLRQPKLAVGLKNRNRNTR